MLPNINDPIATIKLPVSEETISIKPMTVHDIKSLAISNSKDGDILGNYRTVMQILNSKITENIKIENYSTADLEMAFLKMKSISSGEEEEYSIQCPKCKKTQSLTINFEKDAVVDIPEVENIVDITSEVSLRMKPLSYDTIMKAMSKGDKDTSDVDMQFEMIKESVEAIIYDDSISTKESIDNKKFDEWFDGFNVRQLSVLTSYMNSMPSVNIKKDIKCMHDECNNGFEVDIKGLTDFLA